MASQSFIVEFSGVGMAWLAPTECSGAGTACQAHIIIETYSRECNMYFRTIRQRLAALIDRVQEGEPFFRS